MGRVVTSFVVVLACVAATSLATPLDDYVNMPDSTYKYEILSEHRVEGQYIVYVVNMTSQKWLTCKDAFLICNKDENYEGKSR